VIPPFADFGMTDHCHTTRHDEKQTRNSVDCWRYDVLNMDDFLVVVVVFAFEGSTELHAVPVL
jgi:hypothetical protein